MNILIASSTKRFVVFKGGGFMRGEKRNVKTRDKNIPMNEFKHDEM